mmetsp:Transcript_23958/g.56742  ORF Transcript_23958/g.56742 Transcript_23958/m.56742 type:complete len:210 (+) Transcript_23958:2627-3256(+)
MAKRPSKDRSLRSRRFSSKRRCSTRRPWFPKVAITMLSTSWPRLQHRRSSSSWNPGELSSSRTPGSSHAARAKLELPSGNLPIPKRQLSQRSTPQLRHFQRCTSSCFLYLVRQSPQSQSRTPCVMGNGSKRFMAALGGVGCLTAMWSPSVSREAKRQRVAGMFRIGSPMTSPSISHTMAALLMSTSRPTVQFSGAAFSCACVVLPLWMS